MSDHLTPVEVCQRLIGPLPDLERIAHYKPKSAYAWLRSSSDREAGYLPSVKLMQVFLTYAATHHIPLTADHLIWGAPADEIAALQTRADAFPFKARARGPIIEAAE